MTDLQQDLEELAATLPGLPDQVHALLQDTERLRTSAATLLAELGAARTELAKSTEAVHAALTGLDDAGRRMETGLRESGDRAFSSWQGAEGGLGAAVDEVERAADAVDIARLDLQRGLADQAEGIVAGDVEAASAPVQRALQDGVARLASAADGADDQGARLRAALEEMPGALEPPALALRERIEAVAGRVNGEAGFLSVQELHDRTSSDGGARQRLADDVASRVEGIVADVELRLRGGIRDAVVSATEAPVERMTALASAAANGVPALDSARRASVAELATLREVTGPLADVYDQVAKAIHLIGP